MRLSCRWAEDRKLGSASSHVADEDTVLSQGFEEGQWLVAAAHDYHRLVVGFDDFQQHNEGTNT